MRLILALSAPSFGLVSDGLRIESDDLKSSTSSIKRSKHPKWKFIGTKFCKLDKKSKEYKESRIDSKVEKEILKYRNQLEKNPN